MVPGAITQPEPMTPTPQAVPATLTTEALAFLAGITRHGLPALAFAKQAVTRALDLPVHEGLKVEADLSTLAFRTEDADEGLAAFVEKRKPAFKNR